MPQQTPPCLGALCCHITIQLYYKVGLKHTLINQESWRSVNWICSKRIGEKNTENTTERALRNMVCESGKGIFYIHKSCLFTVQLKNIHVHLSKLSFRLSFIYFWQPTQWHFQLTKPFDPYVFMSYKSGFTVSPVSLLYKCQWGRRKAVPWDLEHASVPLNRHVSAVTLFNHKLLLPGS